MCACMYKRVNVNSVKCFELVEKCYINTEHLVRSLEALIHDYISEVSDSSEERQNWMAG